MLRADDLNYIEIGDEAKNIKQKRINKKRAKQLFKEIRDSVIDYVPNAHL